MAEPVIDGTLPDGNTCVDGSSNSDLPSKVIVDQHGRPI